MPSQKLLQVLKAAGLTEKEAAVYLAALSLGPSTVLQLARAAEIKRTTAYSIIESLQTRGLISVEIKGFKKRFAAENPERVEMLLDEQRAILRNSLPDLLSLYNLQGLEGTFKYHQGLAAVKSVYENLLLEVKPKEDYLILGELEQWYQLAPEYFEDFIKRRARLNLNIRMITTDVPRAHERKRLQHIYKDQVRILSPDTTLSTNLVIIPRRVIIHQLIPPIMALTIENQSIIKMHRELFEIIWRSLRE